MEVSTKLRAILARAAILAGVLVALTIVINLSWFDEELHPDLARLLEPAPVSMQDNAFPLIYGFLAANDTDSRAAGLTIVETLRRRFADGKRATLTEAEIDDILGNPDPAEVWTERYPGNACNARFELDCAERLIADVDRTGLTDPRLRRLLDRYEAILQASRFEEIQEYDAYTPIPPYGPVMAVARLRLAESYRSGSTQEFLADMGQDIAFWKIVLRDGQSLIAKMVALAGLRSDSAFLSTLLRERVLDPTELTAVENVLAPLTAAERDIGETFLSELRIALMSSKSFAVMPEGPPAISRLALQEQATLNEYYFTTIVPLRLRASLGASEFFAQRGHESLRYEIRSVPPPLYNLGGKFVLKQMASEMNAQAYISRVHDLDGRIALVLLQAEIAADPERDVAEIVRASRYRNPYTLEPMDYDPGTGRIGFDCLSNPSDVCAIAIDERGL